MTKLSVVVCTYNREQYIGKSLSHLYQQTCNRDLYEVIVVDNNSSDNTSTICAKFLKEHGDKSFHYFVEENQGHTYARNRGIRESSHDLISFIDDDAFVDKNYVNNIISFFEEYSDVKAIGGKIIPKYESKEPPWMSKYLLPLVAAIDMGDSIQPFKGSKFPIGANMAFRKSVFKKYGDFDVNLGRRGEGLEGADEKDLIWRLKKENERIYYVPNVLVDHIIPEKRLSMKYIHGLADGVAKSEIKRIGKLGGLEIAKKLMNETIKVIGTLFLALLHYLSFNFSKANMLIKFRYWVLRGYLVRDQ